MTFIPQPDAPGSNVTLRPEDSPAWMRPALGIDAAHAQRTMGDRAVTDGPWKKEAAVLVLLAGDSVEEGSVLLTHRSPRMRSHSGQIAFPGGRIDPEDLNAVDAALREAWEETGLDRSTVTPVEQWERLSIRATGNPVSPVLAHWHEPSPVGVASPNEADDVFTVPLADLIDPANRLTVGWGQWSGPAFHAQDYVVWGFTGGVLATLLERAGWEEDWDRDTVHPLHETLARSRNNERMR